MIILLVVVVVLAIAGGAYAFATRNLESTDDAYTEGRAVAMAPKVSGYVVALMVNDNIRVHAGDLLVRIDPRDYQASRDQAAAAVALAKAQLASAEVNLAMAKVTYPARLAEAAAQRDAAQANLSLAESQARRQRAVDIRATTQENVDTATSQARSAKANLENAQAQVEAASLVKENIAQAEEQVKQLQAQLQQAEAQLKSAELNLSYTEIRAPQDGWITRRNVELGTYLAAGTSIFSIVTPEVWVVANFKENQLDRIRPGQAVTMSVDAYPGLDLVGHVDSIQMGSGARFSPFPAENATGNYVKIVQRVPVKLVIDRGLDPSRPLPLGLSVVPTVHLE